MSWSNCNHYNCFHPLWLRHSQRISWVYHCLTLKVLESIPAEVSLFFFKLIHSRLGMPLKASAGMLLMLLPAEQFLSAYTKGRKWLVVLCVIAAFPVWLWCFCTCNTFFPRDIALIVHSSIHFPLHFLSRVAGAQFRLTWGKRQPLFSHSRFQLDQQSPRSELVSIYFMCFLLSQNSRLIVCLKILCCKLITSICWLTVQ